MGVLGGGVTGPSFPSPLNSPQGCLLPPLSQSLHPAPSFSLCLCKSIFSAGLFRGWFFAWRSIRGAPRKACLSNGCGLWQATGQSAGLAHAYASLLAESKLLGEFVWIPSIPASTSFFFPPFLSFFFFPPPKGPAAFSYEWQVKSPGPLKLGPEQRRRESPPKAGGDRARQRRAEHSTTAEQSLGKQSKPTRRPREQ